MCGVGKGVAIMSNLTLLANKTSNDFLNCLNEIFEGHAFGYITDKQNNVWFVAKDICRILEIKNVSDAIERLDDDEKSSIVINDRTDGNPTRLIINESGLYSLIFVSRKAVAKRFKKFITSIVIPQIRQTGSFKSSNPKRISEIKALFVREMPSTWSKLFPLELFELFCDLREWTYTKGVSSYTNAMSHLIIKYIYGVLPKEIMEVIYAENYGRSSKLHQWLTDDMAKEIVKTQITKVMTLLKASNNWNAFEVLFNRCNYGQQTLLSTEQL